LAATSWARATSTARVRWLSMLFTRTSRNQPVRTICARPRASLASDLLTLSESAALAWRASRQTTGTPSPLSACQCQVESEPVSRPTRTAPGARAATVAAIASGVDAQRPCQQVLPAPSITQTEVSFCDTSSPTNSSMAPSTWTG
jgi:hypothetical protein